MAPGEVVVITIEPFATSNLFGAATASGSISRPATSRISTSIRTPASPRGWRGAGASRCNTVFVDRKHASHIVLPIVPVKALQAL